MSNFVWRAPRPRAMMRNGRPLDPVFSADEMLYFRCTLAGAETFTAADGSLYRRVRPAYIHFPDQSVNREKYSRPWYVLLPNAEEASRDWIYWGVARVPVAGVPPPQQSGGNVQYAFTVEHDPLDDNFGHAELRVYKNGNRENEKKKINATVSWVRLIPVNTEANGGALGESAEVNGWLLAEGETSFRVLTWFNREETLEKTRMRTEGLLLSEAAESLAKWRQDNAEDRRHALSRWGLLTGQFEPRFVSLPEVLVAAWSYSRGDQESAAAVLFPCIERAKDDRWIVWSARDLIGHGYHQAMLESFSHDRNYDRTIALAQHLSQPIFDGYSYQKCANELIEQLLKRRDDFRTFTLPGEEEWKGLRAQLSREEQIKYLAARLRLLNCIQLGQPGGVSYGVPQRAEAGAAFVHVKGVRPKMVINPYTELRQMRLEIAELQTTV